MSQEVFPDPIQIKIWFCSGPDSLQNQIWTESVRNSQIISEFRPESFQIKIWHQIPLWTASGLISKTIPDFRPDSVQSKIWYQSGPEQIQKIIWTRKIPDSGQNLD